MKITDRFSYLASMPFEHRQFHAPNPPIVTDGNPEFKEDYWDIDHQTRTPLTPDILSDKKHVVCIGDSFTYGHGVQHEHAWPAVMNRKHRDHIFINLGFPGSSLEHATTTLTQWLNVYGEHVTDIIFGVTHPSRRSHYSDPVDMGTMYPHQYQGSIYGINESTLTPINLAALSNKIYVKNASKETLMFHESYFEIDSNTNSYRELEKNMLLVKHMAKTYNANVYTWGEWTTMLTIKDVPLFREYFEDDDFVFMEIPGDDLDRLPLRGTLSKDDGHWSKEGNTCVAKHFLTYFK